MKQRSTFLYSPSPAISAIGDRTLNLTAEALYVRDLEAAREDRSTFSIPELPTSIASSLQALREIHIRWVSPERYQPPDPFSSRLSPGLHILLTPSDPIRDDTGTCNLLQTIFGDDLACQSLHQSFSSPENTSGPPRQFYQIWPDLRSLRTWMKDSICPTFTGIDARKCTDLVLGLKVTHYLDLDFDSTSGNVVIRTLWGADNDTRSIWTGPILKGTAETVEVGVLEPQKPMEHEREILALGGALAVIDADEKIESTLFSFPSRHHSLPPPNTFTTLFNYPTGLHPVLRLSIPPITAPGDFCTLNTYLTMPSTFFPDKYQLDSELFLAQRNLKRLRSVSGETDLEAPVWAVDKWGSAALLELAPPLPSSSSESASAETWHADIPLHMRYLPPSSLGETKTQFPAPILFWACESNVPDEDSARLDPRVNPFDRVNLGYDSLFDERTTFYHFEGHVEASSRVGGEKSLMMEISVPTLRTRDTEYLGLITGVTVLVGVSWILTALWRALAGESEKGNGREGNAKKER